MRLLFILFSLLIISHLCPAQDNSPNANKIGITYSSFGSNDVVRFEELIGSASYDGDGFYSIGVTYLHPIYNWLELETGIEFSKHTITVNPNLPPDMVRNPYKSNFSLINIPLTVRANFLKYLFVNGGLLMDIDVSNNSVIDSQTGIGMQVGCGVKYDFKFGTSLFVNPYYKSHALIPFSSEDYPQRVLESGIRIGLTYKLNNK